MGDVELKPEGNATKIARQLARQIVDENAICAFWVISALTKMRLDGLDLPAALDIFRAEMKDAAARYDEYVRTT